jgi:hypothetical protein
MFPEPESLAIRSQESADARTDAMVVSEPKAPIDGANVAVCSPSQVQPELRISAALRAAHEDEDGVKWQPSEAQQWTWIVKALPRPPLVAIRKEELDGEELLANDSLGG